MTDPKPQRMSELMKLPGEVRVTSNSKGEDGYFAPYFIAHSQRTNSNRWHGVDENGVAMSVPDEAFYHLWTPPVKMKKVEGWANVYADITRNIGYVLKLNADKGQANLLASDDRIACVPIEFEVPE